MTDHEHHHDHAEAATHAPTTPEVPADFWEARYAGADGVWTGRPNAPLVAQASALTPGRALDLGCGEGGDAIWLAAQGWTVTAVDISPTAVGRGALAADQAGIPADRITWVAHDLGTWAPQGPYDLVSACFFQSPVPLDRAAILRRAAAELAPGGHLLVVSHAAPPGGFRPEHSDTAFPTVEEELAALGADDPDADGVAWETVVAEVQQRDGLRPDGNTHHFEDVVILLRRS